MRGSSIDCLLVRGAIFNRVIEGVLIAECVLASSTMKSRETYFSDLENMPLPCLMVLIHADVISVIKITSYSAFSAITHDQTSHPAEMAVVLKDSKGKVTK